MKHGWEYKKLGEVSEIVGGSTPKTSIDSYWGGEYPWVTPAELNGAKYIDKTERTITDEALAHTNLQLLPVGTVLLSSRAPIGKLAITKIPMYCNQGFKNIIPGDSLYNEFAYWYLTYKKDYIISLGRGATFKEISKSITEKIPIPIPPLGEQKAICSLLDKLSLVIEKKKQQVKELDNLAQTIFYDMFGDPVENEKGWEVKKFGDECSEMKYGTSRPSCENGKYPYLRMCNISNDGHLDLNNLKTIDVPNDEVEKCIVRYGDILFNRTNSIELIGKTCMFDSETPMIIAGYIIRVRLSEKLESRFISCLFNMPSIKKKLRAMAKGAVNQANINSRELASVIIPIPPLSLQQSFAQKVEAIERQKELINQSIREAQTLFDSRMEYYFGE